MPIYTYRCDNCGVQFDRHQHFDEPLLTRCPECEHEALRKVYLPVGVVFKGSGFYVTDHRGSSSTVNTKKADAPAAEKSGGEAKPAAASES